MSELLPAGKILKVLIYSFGPDGKLEVLNLFDEWKPLKESPEKLLGGSPLEKEKLLSCFLDFEDEGELVKRILPHTSGRTIFCLPLRVGELLFTLAGKAAPPPRP